MSVQILQGDVRLMLATLPAESVQCVVTSPPYFGLRAYGTNPQVWGGDPEHAHEWAETIRRQHQPNTSAASTLNPCPAKDNRVERGNGEIRQAHCPCGAWRGELGSEPTPALFIEHLVSIFDEVRRVMRPDACIFVNLGDSYAGSGKGPTTSSSTLNPSEKRHATAQIRQGFTNVTTPSAGIPAKNLLLIPERFAIAMQDKGWIVRSRIAWCKTSAMPESVRDRPTSAWEHIFMFTRQARYYWDQEGVRTPAAASTQADRRPPTSNPPGWSGNPRAIGVDATFSMAPGSSSANLRNFWLLGPEPSREQHYAAFPSEIPRRCILAATSERGQCPACGKPWVRQTKLTPEYEAFKAQQNKWQDDNDDPRLGFQVKRQRKQAHPATVPTMNQTTGWQAGCSCEAGDPVPQLVLDPFLGSGTTALVADQLGRNAVGIELNPEYAEMARRRITNSCPMFVDVEVAG